MVTDTGIGISEAVQGNLFQAFTQADGSTTRKYGGTGLGLAISKQLVELMGGEIGLNSTPGEGSTFWFTARFNKQSTATAAPDNRQDLLSLDMFRVLIVDDNATHLKILSHQLGAWGMIHKEADSGARALELLRAAAAQGVAYDLVILDLMMPEMDGFELARAIKSDPDIAGAHLVLLTAFGQRGHAAVAQEAAIAACLTKPVRQSPLFDCLMNVLNHKSMMSGPEAQLAEVSSDAIIKKTSKASPVKHKLILLAEDNIVNQRVAIRQLQNLGYRADAVADGYEVLEALERIPYDLVLMDCQMPEMDGYEATAEIRRREGEGKHTPIVAMTAHALEGDRAKCLEAGMDDYISKPVKPEDLARVLERLLSDTGTNVNEPASGGAVPSVDMERLYMALGDDPVELSEILDIYLKQMCDSLEKLGRAIESGNVKEVNIIAHNCAGVSATCGMSAIAVPLRELERMGRESRLEGAEILHAQAYSEFDRVRQFLREKQVYGHGDAMILNGKVGEPA
jgi:CheY-like chemotaxis protein/HPt (histidine-containing phosphotransfer) domain-containing protein